MTSSLRFEGYINTCICKNCGLTVNDLVFSGDTDMATSGLAAVTLPGKNEVAAVETTAEEWNKYDTGAIAQRAGKVLGNPGYVVLKHRLFPDATTGKSSYDPVCPSCDEHQFPVKKLSLDEFRSIGKIHFVGESQ